MDAARYSSLDDALDRIAASGIELTNGNSNHAPMVVEALCALGQPEAVMPWLARYRMRMQPRSPARQRIGQDSWCSALGQRERFTDWARFFAGELGEDYWQSVLDRWTARLAPGFCAAAIHGVIRVGHAVRAIAQQETPSRRRELADALASWAATWQQLPQPATLVVEPMPVREAIAHVPLVPPERKLPGNIVSALAALGDLPEFFPVIGWLDAAGAAAAGIAELSELFARVYLANARDVPTTIAFIHGVTSLAALGNIAPYLSEATACSALRYAWQSGCALYACYGGQTAFASDIRGGNGEEQQLVAQAIANGDEHVIKFTEACLSRHRIAASAAYLAAADHAAGMIRPRVLER